MNKETVVNVVCVLIGLVAAWFVFQNLHPENWMSKPTDEITLEDTKGAQTEDVAGHPAGDDIPRISSKEEFDELSSGGGEFVTIEPTGIVETGYSGLKPWADPHKKSRRGGQKLRDKVMESGWDYEGVYLPYYLLECADGSYILAQIPDSCANAIKKGESVTLPIGYKKSSAVINKSLEAVCAKYDTTSASVFYCYDEVWYEEHETVIFIIRIAAAVIILFAISVVLILLCGKIFRFDAKAKAEDTKNQK